MPVPNTDAASDDDRYVGVEGDERLMDTMSMEAIYSVQKMAEVLVAGPDSEREFILFELQQLLDHCLDDTMKILIPVLCEHVPSWNIDLQIKSAQRLFDVVSLKLDPATANMITCASFGVIHASRGKAAPEYDELYNLWGGILVDCLPNLRWTPQEVKDVVALVDIHAKEPLYTSRKVAARVMGALAQCLDTARVEKIVLPRAVQLFDDGDIEVRGTVVESFASVGAALPIRVTENEVWPLIERLLEPPEESRIRATAMRTMAHILESHREKSGPSRLFRDLLPPVFARLSVFARKYSAEDQRLVDDDTYLLLEVASEVYGQFAYSMASFTRKPFRKEAYKAYAGMATCNGPLIRRNCAFNLPGVAKALGERFALELSGLCEYLAKDTDEEVRWILAAGIHETAALLAPRGNFERLFTAVCSLLQDENPMVRMNALAHFHDLLSAFAREGSDPASASVRRLAPVFTDLNMLSEGEWRIQKSLAEQLGKCAEIIPPDALMENVLPLLYRLTEQGTPLVREAAMDATAKALRNIPSIQDRDAAINMFWKAAAKGPFWMRLALLDGGVAAMRVFSYQRFQELFAGQMLQLAGDPVANVRIRVARILPSMSPMCRGTAEYAKAVKQLKNDTDIDVLKIVEVHDKKVHECLRVEKERANHNAHKYRDEQEFYGYLPRTQKRARGRLSSARGNRIKLHMRRPSLEKSSGQLSVSKAIITEAMDISAAASVGGTSHHPKLPESDSAVYLGPSMESVDMYRKVQESVNDLEGSTYKTSSNALASLAGATNPAANIRVAKAPMQSQRKIDSRHKNLNENINVVQKSQGKTARYEARSKSWNGMLAQIPRQLSMEGRLRRSGGSGKTEEPTLSGWSKQGKEAPRKALSALRRRKKKHAEAGSSGMSGGIGAAAGSSSGNRGEMNGVLHGRVVEHVEEGRESRGAVPQTDYASMGSLPSRNANDAKGNGVGSAGGQNVQKWGRGSGGMSVGTSGGRKGSGLGGGHEEEEIDEVRMEGGSGLPSFKGRPPWVRNRLEDEDLEAISNAAHERVFSSGGVAGTNGTGDLVSHGRGVLSSFHNSASKVFGSKSGTSHSVAGGEESNRGGEGGAGGGGFLRGLFRKRR